VLIRTRVSEIREMGRATQGVTLIALDDGTTLSGLQRVVERDSESGAESGGDNGGADIGGDPADDAPAATPAEPTEG
jgi:DNA gyrase subunit A